jgi:hypothetical protein
MELRLFDKSLTEWLGTATNRPHGLAELPSDKPNMPYFIVTPLFMPRGDGPYAKPEAMLDYVFQVTSVGRSPEQVRWMAQLLRDALVERDGDGEYLYALVGIEGATVLPGSRMTDQLGGITKSTEGSLFQEVDTYRMKVE